MNVKSLFEINYQNLIDSTQDLSKFQNDIENFSSISDCEFYSSLNRYKLFAYSLTAVENFNYYAKWPSEYDVGEVLEGIVDCVLKKFRLTKKEGFSFDESMNTEMESFLASYPKLKDDRWDFTIFLIVVTVLKSLIENEICNIGHFHDIEEEILDVPDPLRELLLERSNRPSVVSVFEDIAFDTRVNIVLSDLSDNLDSLQFNKIVNLINKFIKI